jgi:hypothetical protein
VDRALGCGPKGREFESRRARQHHKVSPEPGGFLSEKRPRRRNPPDFLNGLVIGHSTLDEQQDEFPYPTA